MRTLQSKVPKVDNFIRDFKVLPLEIHLSEGINVFSKNLRAKILNVCHCVLAHTTSQKMEALEENMKPFAFKMFFHLKVINIENVFSPFGVIFVAGYISKTNDMIVKVNFLT